MRKHRPHFLCLALLLAGCLLALAGCGFSPLGALESVGSAILNPFGIFTIPGADADQPGKLINDPTGLISILGWMSRSFCVIGGITVFIGLLLRSGGVITAGAISLGMGLGIGAIRGTIAAHPIAFYACCGLGIAALAAKVYYAKSAIAANRAAGRPVIAIPFTKRSRTNARPLERHPDPARTGRPDLVRPRQVATGDDPAAHLPAREWSDGPRAAD